MYPLLEKRRSITLVLSLFISFFLCASYWLWSGGEHVRLVPSFQDGEVKDLGKEVVTKPLPASPVETVKSGSTELRPDEIVLAEYDETPIREVCAKSSWADSRNVVVNCEARVGGVGNVRQEFLVCVRQAIEIGASLIRPDIMLRSEGLIEYQNGPVHNMSYLFNLELFDARLRSACPHMPIYNDLAEVERVGEIARVGRPWDLPKEQGVQLSFTAWAKLNRQAQDKITVITMPRITGQTPIDAVNVGYTSFEEQTAAYLAFIAASPIRTIYAASGNTTSLELFAIEAAKLSPPATVVAKGGLLVGADKAALEALTWDQQALVDYLVLEKAARFAGVSDSSFSWGIAYARQVVSVEAGTCKSAAGLEKGVQFRDELSTVFGRPRDWHMDKLWP
ncbi:hypothetical protein VC83_02588 [Pseudogymnoascus destructans]|uniref:Uncharacterized protein n=1 Tax=Pseudogymnoascus destructans TaxID=655981 RepID=A0A177AIB8_9PEZI|nr:uncharacterized protein VC83_02588 [Pseudogymnoascus destructans]OAF60993.1 hypothetical protein VC83_02588 [Pseudogymnoascus destructans]